MIGRCCRTASFLRGAAILLVLVSASGCFGSRKGAAPPPDFWKAPSTDNLGSPASAVFPPAIPVPEESAPGIGAQTRAGGREEQVEAKGEAPAQGSDQGPAEPDTPGAAASRPSGAGEGTGESREAATETSPAPPEPPAGTEPREPPSTERPAQPLRSPETPAQAKKPKSIPPLEPDSPVREPLQAAPWWARQKEVLAYRVDFIGITMGYARFDYQGKVTIGGQVAYHLKVRAWTSGVLSYIYPINETIDYYLDTETLAPIRQEFTERTRGKDDVAIYDQETGKITYRYRQSGEIRKEVETVPEIYDPVSAVYYFRWRDLGGEEKARNVYAGRKVWQISARVLGTERVQTSAGEVDTLVIRPMIRREGKPENKGDLKMWVSNDERRVPVRLYAKFRKIKDWTLVGELIPAQKRG